MVHKELINGDEASQDNFMKRMKSNGGGSYCDMVVVTPAELKALQQGEWLAIDDGEATTFIMLGAGTPE